MAAEKEEMEAFWRSLWDRHILKAITSNFTLLGTNVSPPRGTFESTIFLFVRWDMLVPERVSMDMYGVVFFFPVLL